MVGVIVGMEGHFRSKSFLFSVIMTTYVLIVQSLSDEIREPELYISFRLFLPLMITGTLFVFFVFYINKYVRFLSAFILSLNFLFLIYRSCNNGYSGIYDGFRLMLPIFSIISIVFIILILIKDTNVTFKLHLRTFINVILLSSISLVLLNNVGFLFVHGFLNQWFGIATWYSIRNLTFFIILFFVYYKDNVYYRIQFLIVLLLVLEEIAFHLGLEKDKIFLVIRQNYQESGVDYSITYVFYCLGIMCSIFLIFVRKKLHQKRITF